MDRAIEASTAEPERRIQAQMDEAARFVEASRAAAEANMADRHAREDAGRRKNAASARQTHPKV
jgi:hypothetical protein